MGLSGGSGIWACVRGSQPLIRVHTQLRFQLWAPRPLMEVRAHPGALRLCTHAAEPFIRVRAHPGFPFWAPGSLIWLCASLASGECWGCLSCTRRPGAEVGGAPGAAAAAESSLTSP